MKYIKLNAFTLDLNLSKNELIVYNYLLTINDFIPNPKLYLSYAQIGYECRINRRSVIRTIQSLLDKDLLDKKLFKNGIMIMLNQSKIQTRSISLLLDNLTKKWTN